MDKIKQGRISRRKGKAFELRVRKDLESKGWIVFRNSNDVIDNKFKQTTGHWNPFTKTIMVSQTGFPDFICIKQVGIEIFTTRYFEFVECKINGKLDKTEKEKIDWVNNNLKIPVIIASKKDGEIIYE